MTTLMYRLENERLSAEKNKAQLELVKNLLQSLEMFKGDFTRQNLINSLPEKTKEESFNDSDLKIEDFLKQKLSETILRLPEELDKKPESKLDIYKEKFEKSSGNIENFTIVLEFFKDVVWDYSINLFSIMMGSKNPAAELYEYTNEASKTILANLRANEVSDEEYQDVKDILQNINNQLWVMQKKQKIQNCDEVVNFNLAGLIFASSFALATLSIISPLVGIQIGFGSIMSALYLSGGIALLSGLSFGASYLHQADLKIRSSDTSGTIQDLSEDALDASIGILTPVINFCNEMLGFETPEKPEINKEGFEDAARAFTNKI